MRNAFVILLCVCAIGNAQFTNSDDQVAAFEETLDNVPDPAIGEANFSETSLGEGGAEARSYNEDSEVITGVTDSSVVNNGELLNQPYVQVPADQDEAQSAPQNLNARCVEKNERYPVPGSCDRYIECLNGTAEEKLCPDGLRYNPNVKFNVYPCQYPSDVPCRERSALQPPQPTEDCPHQFGYFKLGDSKNCSGFKNCVNGIGYDFTCPEGLAFSSDTYRCEWPDQVADCDVEAFLGFKCPEVPISKELGPPAGYRFYRSSTNCQKYFICIEGKPRSLGCGGYSAFDELTSSCVSADEVDSCPAELRSAATRSRAAEQQRLTAEEFLNEKLLRSQPYISTVTPRTLNGQAYSTVTAQPYYSEFDTATGDPSAAGGNF